MSIRTATEPARMAVVPRDHQAKGGGRFESYEVGHEGTESLIANPVVEPS